MAKNYISVDSRRVTLQDRIVIAYIRFCGYQYAIFQRNHVHPNIDRVTLRFLSFVIREFKDFTKQTI